MAGLGIKVAGVSMSGDTTGRDMFFLFFFTRARQRQHVEHIAFELENKST